jgi:hypothetical protein
MAKTKYFADDELMGTRPVVKEPVIVSDVLSPEKFQETLNTLNGYSLDELKYDRSFGRFMLKNPAGQMPDQLLEHCLQKARDIFDSQTLLPTYSCYVRYKGARANLLRHMDSNACTYTVDLCLTSSVDWPLYVEDREYLLKPNQALCFYGEDQLHWRGPFPEKDSNIVDMLFLHYAEPDHWYFTQGPEYYQKILADTRAAM